MNTQVNLDSDTKKSGALGALWKLGKRVLKWFAIGIGLIATFFQVIDVEGFEARSKAIKAAAGAMWKQKSLDFVGIQQKEFEKHAKVHIELRRVTEELASRQAALTNEQAISGQLAAGYDYLQKDLNIQNGKLDQAKKDFDAQAKLAKEASADANKKLDGLNQQLAELTSKFVANSNSDASRKQLEAIREQMKSLLDERAMREKQQPPQVPAQPKIVPPVASPQPSLTAEQLAELKRRYPGFQISNGAGKPLVGDK